MKRRTVSVSTIEKMIAIHVSKLEENIHRVTRDIEGLREEIGNLETQRNEFVAELKITRKVAEDLLQVERESMEERGQDMNKVCPDLMDSRDAMRVNIFTEAIERLGDDLSRNNILANMNKLNYYIYDPKWKLWTGIEGFRQDYQDWLDCKGHWAQLPKSSDGSSDEMSERG